MLSAMSDAKTKALSGVPLFAHCSPRELAFLASKTDEVELPSDRQVTRQGHPAEAFYVLLSGEAEVEQDGKHRRTLGPGDFFGEISMLDRGPATATIVTRSECRLMVMSHLQFRDAIKGSDPLLGQVMAAMAQRLRSDSLERTPS
jgi:CRP-like cAMP-binding protein